MIVQRRWMVVSLAAVVAFAVAPVVAAEAYTETIDQTYEMAADGRVSLDNVNGDVTVEAWDQPQVWLRAEKSASTPDLLEALEIEVEAGASGVHVKTHYPNQMSSRFGEGSRAKVTYTLTVPRTAVVDGFDLVNGDLKISGVVGAIHAETVNGSIEVADAAGDLRLETVNGAIDAYCGYLDPQRRVALESVNGHIRVHLAPSASVDLDVETVNGSITNDFGLAVNKHKYVGADLKATLGGGGAELRIETVNGGISVVDN